MTHDKAGYTIRSCELGHVHFDIRNRAGLNIAELTLTPAQARDLMVELAEVTKSAERALANVPGVVGGDHGACR